MCLGHPSIAPHIEKLIYSPHPFRCLCVLEGCSGSSQRLAGAVIFTVFCRARDITEKLIGSGNEIHQGGSMRVRRKDLARDFGCVGSTVAKTCTFVRVVYVRV